MGNKQASGDTLGSCQKTEISNGIVLLKPVEHQNFSALQISSDSVASVAETYLKILRHPNILRYVDSRYEDGQLVIVVEKCSLLDLTRASDQEICYGLFSILTLVEFLHQEVKLCGIDFEHMFTTSNGTWKIGLFHKAKKITSANDILEDLQRLGELAVKAVGRCNLPHSEELEVLISDLLRERQLDQKFISQLKSHAFFNDPFLETVTFLDNFLLKSLSERKSFFQGLDKKVDTIPEEVVAKLLTAKFLSRHVVLDETAQAVFLPKFLTPLTNGEDPASDGFLSLRLFKDFVIPEIVRIFHVREVEVRLVFLKNFHRYFQYIEKPVLVEDILPEIMLGVRDTHNTLVAETLRVLSTLVDFLGAEVVLGGNRVKIFADGRPKSQRDEAIQLSIRERLNPISQEGPRSDLENQFSRIEAKAEFLPERIPPEGGEDVVITSQLLFNRHEEQLNDGDEKDEEWTSWGGEKKEVDVTFHDFHLELNHSVKDEKQQYHSASDSEIQEENQLEVVFTELKNKSTVDHIVVDEKYEEWSGWDDTAKIETKARLGSVSDEPEEDHSINNGKDHRLSVTDNMIDFHGKNKKELFSEPETIMKSSLNKVTSDWSAWDHTVMDLKDENVLRKSGDKLSEEAESPRKPKVKALSLKAKGKDAVSKPSNSINTVNTPSQNQTSRHNALPLSSKSLREKNNSKKTDSSLGSEFDVMAIDLKIKQTDDPVDKLFEEFFGNTSSQVVPSRNNEIIEEVVPLFSKRVEVESEAGLEPVQKKNLFAAIQVEEVGDPAEEGSGWDDF